MSPEQNTREDSSVDSSNDGGPYSDDVSVEDDELVSGDESANNDRWGLIAFRTYYDDEALWEKTKEKLEEARVMQSDGIEEEEDGNPETATFVFIEDPALFKNKSAVDVRLIFNPHFNQEEKNLRDETDPLPGVPAGYDVGMGRISPHVFLVIDEACMRSIVANSPPRESYVIVVDAVEDMADDNPPWDGTFKLCIYDIFAEFYMRTIDNNMLTMYEVRPPTGRIWNSLFKY